MEAKIAPLEQHTTTRNWNEEFWKIVQFLREDYQQTSSLDSIISSHIDTWIGQASTTIPAFVEALHKVNASRRIGGFNDIAKIDSQVFVTQDPVNGEIRECYSIDTQITPSSKKYAETTYQIEIFKDDSVNTIKVSPKGEIVVSSTNLYGQVEQLSSDQKEIVINDFFVRAATAQWRQAQRSPEQKTAADRSALARAMAYTGLGGKETSLE